MIKRNISLRNNLIIFFGFILILFLFLIKVDLSLLYHNNQPFFSIKSDFLIKHLAYPKGISDYIGLFLFQFYEKNAVALILAFLHIFTWGWLIYHILKKYIPSYFIAIPVILSTLPLIVWFGCYQFLPEIPIELIISMTFSLLFQKSKTKNYALYFLFVENKNTQHHI